VGPVIEEFDAGWLLDTDTADSEWAPDFVALFPVRDCDCGEEDCKICGDWHLTPRTADMLHAALSVMSDGAYDDIEEHGDTPVSIDNQDSWMVFDRLPRITWRQDAEWRRGIAHACEDLIRDLEEGNWPQPRNNAEEIVMHLAVRDAPGLLEMAEDAGNEEHEALPRHSDDYDWDGCSELLFEDHDILWLYNNRMDGVEDPDSELNQQYGVGDMRPASWFDWFGGSEPRDPARRFRG
jgi:hypothetical protein